MVKFNIVGKTNLEVCFDLYDNPDYSDSYDSEEFLELTHEFEDKKNNDTSLDTEILDKRG